MERELYEKVIVTDEEGNAVERFIPVVEEEAEEATFLKKIANGAKAAAGFGKRHWKPIVLAAGAAAAGVGVALKKYYHEATTSQSDLNAEELPAPEDDSELEDLIEWETEEEKKEI